MPDRIGFTSAAIVFLYMVVLFGSTRLLALKHQGHPFADAWVKLF